MGIHGHGTGILNHSGFTALELMVTLAIAAILLLTGVPSFHSFSARQRMNATVSLLHSDLLAARSEAIYRGAPVVACPGTPGQGCDGGNDWGRGWIVFEDVNSDRQRQSGEVLLRHGQTFGQVAIFSQSSRTELRFFPDGSAPGSNGTISLCGSDGPGGARKLVISNIGRIRRDTHPDIEPTLCPA